MNEKVNLDYTLNGDYAVSSSTQNSSQNVLINKEVADLIAHRGAKITCICGYEFITRMYGTNCAAHLNAFCSNQQCYFHNIPRLRKIFQYHPLNLSLTYLTLKNDTGYRGNILNRLMNNLFCIYEKFV